jgi:hypothetical protein
MPSSAGDTALRDILHHIDLAGNFAAGFDQISFKGDLKTVYAARDAWRSFPKRRAACRMI